MTHPDLRNARLELRFGPGSFQGIPMMFRLSTLGLASAILLLSGCRDREIVSYRAPKDTARTAPPAAAMPANPGQLPEGHPPIGDQAAAAGTMPSGQGQLPDGHPPIGGPAAAAPAAPGAMTGTVPTAQGGALVWTAPAHWTAKPLGSMRKGSYAVPGEAGATADLAITAFPGDTGGLFANVNRWRGQVGLPPVAEAELKTAVEHLDIGSLHIDLVYCIGQAGGQPTALLGAIVPHNGETWFFKLLGPAALVAKEKAAFRDFLATIKAR